MRTALGVVGLAVLLWLAYTMGQQSVRTAPVGPGGDSAAAPAGRALVLTGEPDVLPYGANSLQVVGRVKNTGTTSLSGGIRVTLFGRDGKIVATSVALITRLPPGEEITYQAVALRPEQWASVEAKVTGESAP